MGTNASNNRICVHSVALALISTSYQHLFAIPSRSVASQMKFSLVVPLSVMTAPLAFTWCNSHCCLWLHFPGAVAWCAVIDPAVLGTHVHNPSLSAGQWLVRFMAAAVLLASPPATSSARSLPIWRGWWPTFWREPKGYACRLQFLVAGECACRAFQ